MNAMNRTFRSVVRLYAQGWTRVDPVMAFGLVGGGGGLAVPATGAERPR